MSLYVFISRKPDPTMDEGQDIPESDWRALIRSQPDFRMPTTEELATPSVPGGPQTSDFIWQRKNGEEAWFSFYSGQVEVKSADPSIIARMQELASSLAARVVSETGESFDAKGEHAGFEQWSEFYVAPPRPSLLRRLFGNRSGS